MKVTFPIFNKNQIFAKNNKSPNKAKIPKFAKTNKFAKSTKTQRAAKHVTNLKLKNFAAFAVIAFFAGIVFLPAVRGVSAEYLNKDDFIFTVDTRIDLVEVDYRENAYFIIGRGANADNFRQKYNYNVDCNNDGINEATNRDTYYICMYDEPGEYTIRISGSYPAPTSQIQSPDELYNEDAIKQELDDKNYNYSSSPHGLFYGAIAPKIIDINQWGTQKWESLYAAFLGAYNLKKISAKDVPDFSELTNMAYAFAEAVQFDADTAPRWNTSKVKTMYEAFCRAYNFNQDLSNWDFSSLTRSDETSDISCAPGVSFYSTAAGFLRYSGMSRENYDKLLKSLSERDLQPGIQFGGAPFYSSESQKYIDIIEEKGWDLESESVSVSVSVDNVLRFINPLETSRFLPMEIAGNQELRKTFQNKINGAKILSEDLDTEDELSYMRAADFIAITSTNYGGSLELIDEKGKKIEPDEDGIARSGIFSYVGGQFWVEDDVEYNPNGNNIYQVRMRLASENEKMLPKYRFAPDVNYLGLWSSLLTPLVLHEESPIWTLTFEVKGENPEIPNPENPANPGANIPQKDPENSETAKNPGANSAKKFKLIAPNTAQK